MRRIRGRPVARATHVAKGGQLFPARRMGADRTPVDHRERARARAPTGRTGVCFQLCFGGNAGNHSALSGSASRRLCRSLLLRSRSFLRSSLSRASRSFFSARSRFFRSTASRRSFVASESGGNGNPSGPTGVTSSKSSSSSSSDSGPPPRFGRGGGVGGGEARSGSLLASHGSGSSSEARRGPGSTAARGRWYLTRRISSPSGE